MTLNQIIKRVREISLSHAQVKTFQFAKPTDFLNEETLQYAAIFLQDNGGVFDSASKIATFNFRMFALDLVNVSEETKENELDVLSDMVSICMDILSLLNSPDYYGEWRISSSNNFELVIEKFNDMCAGVVADFTISTIFNLDRCAVPLNL